MRRLLTALAVAAVACSAAPVALAAITMTFALRQSPNRASSKHHVRPIALAADFTVEDVVKKERDGTYTDNVDIPSIPTVPGQPNAATLSVHLRLPRSFVKRKVVKRVRGKPVGETVKLPYIGAPTVCNGSWTYTGK